MFQIHIFQEKPCSDIKEDPASLETVQKKIEHFQRMGELRALIPWESIPDETLHLSTSTSLQFSY